MGHESYQHRFAKETLAGWFRSWASEADDYVDRILLAPYTDRKNKLGGHRNYLTEEEVIRWRVNRSGPHWGVWTEYPVGATGCEFTTVWDECGWPVPPSYDEYLRLKGRAPAAIIDVVVQHKGAIPWAFEVVHKHPPTQVKIGLIRGMRYPGLFAISAEWILAQVNRPGALRVHRLTPEGNTYPATLGAA